jgi:glycerol kinase
MTADGLILALDQGTTSSRAVLVDHSGRIVATAQRELTQHYPRPGWVEQDPAEIWATQRDTAREVLAKAGVGGLDAAGGAPARIAAIGITDQRETTIVWDRATGEPVAPAIVWQDRRTADRCEELRRAGCEPLLRRKTGLLLDPYFSATKLRWILEAVPDGLARAQAGELAFGTVDTWLIWNLTGGRRHLTDATNASRTALCDITRGAWDDELLELFGVPRAVLPEVSDSSGVIAETDPEVLGAAIPVAGVAGDQQAALFGQACTKPGLTKVTYGTGCFLLMHAGEQPIEPPPGLLTTVALQRDGRRSYAVEGSVFVGGAVVQWLRDGLGVIEQAAQAGTLAESVESSGGVCFVPALTGLGAPHWDPQARGAIFGITRGTTKAHVARAALEGIAFQVDDLVRAIVEGCSLRPLEVRADGGAASSDLLLAAQADLLGVPVLRAAQLESTALGAAYLAGLGVGFWRDEAEVESLWRAATRFEPRPDPSLDARRAAWRRAVACVRAFAADGPPA